MVGNALTGPLHGGGEQRLLDGVLAGVEPAVSPHERAEDPRRQSAQQILGPVGNGHISMPEGSMIGRTSTAPSRASGNRPASSTARSRVSQSTTM